MSGTFPGKAHNNLNNCVREKRAPDDSFAAAGFQERYVPLALQADRHSLSFLGEAYAFRHRETCKVTNARFTCYCFTRLFCPKWRKCGVWSSVS